MTRTFIAIELGDAARAQLAREIARLARALPGVRWVDPASLHVTLAFLGELDDAQVAAAEEAAEEASRTSQPFALAVGALGIFGPPTAPRVIWAGLDGALDRLIALQRELAGALRTRAFAAESRPFAPHLTLARLRTPPSATEAARLADLLRGQAGSGHHSGALIAVERISVMKSELRREGARYTCLRAISLGGAPPTAD